MYVNLMRYNKSGYEETFATIRVENGALQIEGEIPPRQLDVLNAEWARSKVRSEAFLMKLPRVFNNPYGFARVKR